MRQEIKSIGIDIGTSTTQLVFSRIVVENVAGSYNVPRVSIVEKEVIYRSKIYFTPLRSATEIDAEAVQKIVSQEYKAAGMKPEDLSRITEAFYRVDKSRSRAQGGAGLGLALCQAIAELHHGQLIFESTPGKGTVVKAILNGGRTKCE